MREDWIEVELGDICGFVGGGTPSKKNTSYWNGKLSWASIKDLKSDFLNKTQDFITEDGLKNSSANLAMPNDIILATRINPGKPIISKIKTAINQDLKVVRTKIDIDSRFLFYSLKGLEKDIVKVSSGTTVLGVNLNNLRAINYNLAPLPIQRSIVSKIEALFSDLENGIADLKKAQEQLKVYRQAVLKKAFEGELTKEWREQQTDLPSAEVLLEQIKQEGCNSRKVISLSDDEIKEQNELPKIWKWASTDIFAKDEKGAICAGPFGTIFKAKDFREEGIPIIFLRHVKPNNYNTKKPGFMDRKRWEDIFQSYSVFGGELLVTKLGDPPGECAIYPDGIGPAMVTPDVIKMSVNEKCSVKKYLMYYLNSVLSRRQYEKAAFGTTRLRVTIPIFRKLPIPYCSVEEQHQIVREIESRLSVCDKVEQNIAEALDKSEALRQSILKKAFEGKLLSDVEIAQCKQEADYEPASELLKKIKAEKK